MAPKNVVKRNADKWRKRRHYKLCLDDKKVAKKDDHCVDLKMKRTAKTAFIFVYSLIQRKRERVAH